MGQSELRHNGLHKADSGGVGVAAAV